MGGKVSKGKRQRRLENFCGLASETAFRVDEVEALYELFKKLSSSVVRDGFIHKEKLQLALFRNSKKQNLFADRLKEMVMALLNESESTLTDDMVQEIVDKTFSETDTKGDGRIDMDEWKEYVAKNPSVLKNMTIPYLIDITLAFPSFMLNTEAEDSELRKSDIF